MIICNIMLATQFWEDPKTWIALIALFLSMYNIVVNVLNQNRQEKKWKALNVADFDITLSQMQSFKKLNYREATETLWGEGYTPLLFYVEDDFGSIMLKSALVVLDGNTKTKIGSFDFVYTIAEAEQHISKINLSPQNVALNIVLRYKIEITNIGNIEATNLRYNICLKLPEDSSWQEINKGDSISAFPKQKFYAQGELYVPSPIPEIIGLKIGLSYDHEFDKNNHTTFYIEYRKHNDEWQYKKERE